MIPEIVIIKIFNKSGKIEEKHAHARGQFADLTICGEDMAGDDDREILYPVKPIKINCPRCIAIINYCKSIDKEVI